MEQTDKKHTWYLAVIIILALALIVSVIWLARAESKVSDLQSSAALVMSQEEVLSVCNDTSTAQNEAACVEQLSRLSNILDTYSAKLKSIQNTSQ